MIDNTEDKIIEGLFRELDQLCGARRCEQKGAREDEYRDDGSLACVGSGCLGSDVQS